MALVILAVASSFVLLWLAEMVPRLLAWLVPMLTLASAHLRLAVIAIGAAAADIKDTPDTLMP